MTRSLLAWAMTIVTLLSLASCFAVPLVAREAAALDNFGPSNVASADSLAVFSLNGGTTFQKIQVNVSLPAGTACLVGGVEITYRMTTYNPKYIYLTIEGPGTIWLQATPTATAGRRR